jgi:hypothetical protein
MCVDPVTLSAGATVIGTGLSIMDRVSQSGNAKANRGAALNAVLNGTIPAINESLGQVYNANAAKTVQEQDKAAVEKFDILRGMAEAKGTAMVAAGDAGVGGVSFANILSDFETREGLAKGNIDYNVRAKTQAIADENLAAQGKAKAQINSAINAAVIGTPIPSDTGMWAGIGADTIKAGLSIGDKYGLFDNKTKVDPKTGTTYPSKA